jgi:hypothetical protein
MGNWKAVKLNIDKDIEFQTELYDLSTDMGETKNIARARPDILVKMEEIMKQAHIPSEDFPFTYEIKK